MWAWAGRRNRDRRLQRCLRYRRISLEARRDTVLRRDPFGGGRLENSVAEVVIKGLQIKGDLVGNLKECLEAVELVRSGKVKPHVFGRTFGDLPRIYESWRRATLPAEWCRRLVTILDRTCELTASCRLSAIVEYLDTEYEKGM